MTVALARRGTMPLASPASSLSSSSPVPAPISDEIEALVARGYRTQFPLDGGVEAHLRAVIEDTLEHPGRLIRARLAYSLARSHALGAEVALALAIAIEYFHTASLLFDDLPAMDDALERRSRPCPHVVHGEGAAILGALAFVARGYALLWEALDGLPTACRLPASRLVGECLGTGGILGGQARDLRFAEAQAGARDDAQRTAEEVLRVAEGKTVALIRLTLLLPALAGGAREAELERLESLARSWGLAYQILDDFKDRLLTGAEAGKTTARDAALDRPNVVVAEGASAALRRLEDLVAVGRRETRQLAGERRRWAVVLRVQTYLERELRELRRRLAFVFPCPPAHVPG